MKKSVAQIFKAARKKQGLTQKEVADKAGIFSNTYARIERGVQNPGYDTARSIARALGVDLPK